MKMDIACPVELLNIEQEAFGETRRQAYLTFLNEAPYPVAAVSGVLALLAEGGGLIEERRISFGGIGALPGARFTCHLALDGYPAFDGAEMVVEDVVYDADEPPWALHPLRLRDYTPPALAEGPDRIALIAVAGEDAVCFPQQQEGQWVCVCGRFNRWRWPVCRRCRRERDAVLALTPQRVAAMYHEKLDRDRQRPPKVIVDGGKPRAKAAERVAREKAPPREGVGGRVATVAACLLVAGLLVWGVASLIGRMGGGQGDVSGGQTPPIHADYLDPIR